MKLYKQINNLRIYNHNQGGWCVKSPDGRILEEFGQRHSAEEWCQNTYDFVKRKPKN